MSKQTAVNLPTLNTHSSRILELTASNIGTDRLFAHMQRQEGYFTSHYQPGRLVLDLVTEYETDKQEVERDHARADTGLKQSLDKQVHTAAGPLEGLPELEAIGARLTATEQLLASKRVELIGARHLALAFYGTDPIGKTVADYLRIASSPNAPENPRKTWLASFKAAYEARLLSKSVDHLVSRSKGLEVSRKSAERWGERAARQEKKREQKIHKVELALLNLDQARHKHASSLHTLEEHLARFSRDEPEAGLPLDPLLSVDDIRRAIAELLEARNALRTARFEINSQSMRLGMDQKLLQVELNFPLADATRARINQRLEHSAQAVAAYTAAKPEIDRLTEEGGDRAMTAVDNAQRELARLAALEGSEAHQRPATFSLATSAVLQPQVITPSASSMAALAGVRPALKAALRAVRPVLKGKPRVAVEIASLLLFSLRLGHDERYGLSIPFTDLNLDIDWREVLEHAGESFPLPMRLISGLVDQNAHVEIVPTNAEGISPQVPVRAATWDEARGAYRFTSEGPGAITVLWTPEAAPGDSSTSLPAEAQPDRLYPGFISVPTVPEMVPLPASDDVDFHDYIITFPADSGLEPVYIMFKNPRDYAGAGTGNGRDISGWREAIYGPSGAPIPTRIADQLRGRMYGRWDKMREEIWKALASDPELSKHFKAISLNKMRNGGAPFTEEGLAGKRRVLELHHIHPVAEGGAVYDIDNLLIMTPRAHIDSHKKGEK